MSLEQAFTQAIENSKTTGQFFVVLWRESQFYGGPQEGGWWGTDYIPEQYAVFSTEEAAEAAKKAVETLAKQLSKEARQTFGQACQAQMDWCDARGLDYDYLPEVDGEDRYSVTVEDSPPQAQYGNRHWE